MAGSAPFVFTEKQNAARNLMSGTAMHVLLYGGARSGKTFIILRQIALRAIKEAASRHVCLRFRFNHAKASIWHDTWPKMMRLCFPDVAYKPNRSDWFWRFPHNGSEVWIGGIDDKDRAEKVLGQEYATALLSEASQIPFSSREIIRTRLAQKTGLRLKIFYDENPPLKSHWTYRLFIEKRQPEPPFDKLPDHENYAVLKLNPKDNEQNLPPETILELQRLSPRAKLRFWEGEFGDTTEGALFTWEVIERNRRVGVPDVDMLRIVVAVDPSGTKGDAESHGDEIGIIVVGLGIDGHAYVFEDVTVSAPPAVWGKVAATAYQRHGADVVVGEINYGGAMVENTVQSAAKDLGMDKVKYKEVHASRGKVVRAEPISALYEQNLVHHVGSFPDLEDQMMAFTTRGYMGDRSPDRADALVWALSEIFPRVLRADRREKEVIVQGVGGGYYDPLTGGPG
jgi:Terminase RNaseH-like domain/Phage terminase large subunit